MGNRLHLVFIVCILVMLVVGLTGCNIVVINRSPVDVTVPVTIPMPIPMRPQDDYIGPGCS